MNIAAQRVRSQARPPQADRCRHPSQGSMLEDLRPYLSNHWWNYLQTYGSRHRHGYVKGFPYPESRSRRRRAATPGRRMAACRAAISISCASNISIVSGVEYAIMNPLSPTGQGEQNNELQRRARIARQRMADERGWRRRSG